MSDDTATVQTYPGLPPYCYTLNPENKRQVILLRLGTSGYYPIDMTMASEEEAAVYVNTRNIRAGVSLAQVEAMMVGSMFGWDAPGANPREYDPSAPQTMAATVKDLLEQSIYSKAAHAMMKHEGKTVISDERASLLVFSDGSLLFNGPRDRFVFDNYRIMGKELLTLIKEGRLDIDP